MKLEVLPYNNSDVQENADVDLSNISNLAQEKLQSLRLPVYSVHSGSVDENGNAEVLDAVKYIEYTYTNAGTYMLELPAGQYNIEMYGAGGAAYNWAYQKAFGYNGGGSGAGFRGIVELADGTYTITVGAVGSGGAGGNTSLENLIIAGGGGYSTQGYGEWLNNCAPGGTLIIDESTVIVSSELQTNGKTGYARHYDGGGHHNTANSNDGGLSVYDNTVTGWGAGVGAINTGAGVGGYFKIARVSDEFSNLKIYDFVATDLNGKTFKRLNINTVNVSSLADGTYNIYIGETGEAVLYNNTHFIQRSEPVSPAINDVWVDSSVAPLTVKKFNGEVWEEFNLNYLGYITVSNGIIINVKSNPYNDNGWVFNSNTISAMCMPSDRYIDLTLKASGETYIASANGWFYISKIGNASQYFAFINKTRGYTQNFRLTSNNTYLQYIFPCQKGDIVAAEYTLSGATSDFRFFYAQGAQ